MRYFHWNMRLRPRRLSGAERTPPLFCIACHRKRPLFRSAVISLTLVLSEGSVAQALIVPWTAAGLVSWTWRKGAVFMQLGVRAES
jgi:hypothetical protein